MLLSTERSSATATLRCSSSILTTIIHVSFCDTITPSIPRSGPCSTRTFWPGRRKGPLLNRETGSHERADAFDFVIGKRLRLAAESHDRFHPAQPQHGYSQSIRIEAREYIPGKHRYIDYFGAIRPQALVLIGREKGFHFVKRRQAVPHTKFVSRRYR